MKSTSWIVFTAQGNFYPLGRILQLGREVKLQFAELLWLFTHTQNTAAYLFENKGLCWFPENNSNFFRAMKHLAEGWCGVWRPREVFTIPAWTHRPVDVLSWGA